MYILYIYKAITLKYNIAFHNCQAFFLYSRGYDSSRGYDNKISTIEIMRAVYRHAQVFGELGCSLGIDEVVIEVGFIYSFL